MTTSLKLTTALVASLSLVVPTAVPAQQHDAETQNAALDCPEGLVPAPLATDTNAAADAAGADASADGSADHAATEDRECVTPEEAAARATAASSSAEDSQSDPAQADAAQTDPAHAGTTASGDAAAGTDTSGTAGMDAGSATSGAASGMTEGSGDAGITALGNSTESGAATAEGAAGADAAATATPDASAGADAAAEADAGAAPADAATGTDGAAATAATDATGSATSGTDTTAPAATAQTGASDTGATTGTDPAAAAATPSGTEGAAGTGAAADATAGADATTGTDATAGSGAPAEADAASGAGTSADTAPGDTAMPAGTAADAQAAGGAGAAAGAQATGDAAATDQTAATMAAEEQAAAEANAATEAAAQLQALMPGADAASGDTQAQPQDVQTETVTEENSRSSGEEFDSQIQATAAANETGTTATEDNKGLTDLEKALVLGAGALAVGQLLGNNRQVVTSSNDRVVVSRGDGSYEIIKDDNALLRQPGSQVQTETFSDGSTRTTVTRDDGTKIVTIRDPQLRVVRRVRVDTNGDQVVLIDDTAQVQPVNVTELPRPEARTVDIAQMQDTEDALRQALEQRATYDRNFSLSQIRDIPQVRALAPAIDLDNVTFETGSAAIQPDQADHLATLGRTIKDIIAQNPREVFLVEGHTDAVGDAAYNLALSDRRAESVALALSEYFGVPAENLVVQGYGERFLKVPTEGAERANRRATVRRITPLLQTAAVQ